MRHVFKYAILLMLISVVLAALSTWWRVAYISPSAGTRIMLRWGSLDFWHGSPGDWERLQSEWRGPARPIKMVWTPEFHSMQMIRSMWPSAAPGGGVATIDNYGLRLILPMWMPVAAFLLVTGITVRPWFLHARMARRTRRGRCVGCGYDLKGLAERCPECGRALRRLLARLLGSGFGRAGVRAGIA